MPFKKTFNCVVCGEEKKETNHWWNVCEYTARPQYEECPAITFFPFHSLSIEQCSHECVCGVECAQKALARWQDKIMTKSMNK